MKKQENTLKPAKRTKAEHREIAKAKKEAKMQELKEWGKEIRATYEKMISVKPGDVIFTSGRDLTLWFIAIISFIPIPLTVWLVNLPDEQQMLADWDGSMLKARIFQVAFSLFSGILFFPIMYYLHKYVTTITLLEDDALEFETWGLFGYKKVIYPKEAWIVPVQYHEGRTTLPYVPSVHAPYHSIRPYGKKTGLILDQQGDYPFGVQALDDIIDPFWQEYYSSDTDNTLPKTAKNSTD